MFVQLYGTNNVNRLIFLLRLHLTPLMFIIVVSLGFMLHYCALFSFRCTFSLPFFLITYAFLALKLIFFSHVIHITFFGFIREFAVIKKSLVSIKMINLSSLIEVCTSLTRSDAYQIQVNLCFRETKEIDLILMFNE